MSSVLIAGLGNLFLGDDAFGVEVVQRMQGRPMREGVQIADFGICGIDLTYALLDGVDLAILVDATQRGGPPGSLYLLDASSSLQPGEEAERTSSGALFLSPHAMEPDKVLRSVRLLGGSCGHILLVGCEPESFGTEAGQEGRIGLSDTVAASVEQAIILIESVLDEVAEEQSERVKAS